MVDPYSSITSALGRTGKYTLNTFQVNFTPVADSEWKKNLNHVIKVIT